MPCTSDALIYYRVLIRVRYLFRFVSFLFPTELGGPAREMCDSAAKSHCYTTTVLSLRGRSPTNGAPFSRAGRKYRAGESSSRAVITLSAIVGERNARKYTRKRGIPLSLSLGGRGKGERAADGRYPNTTCHSSESRPPPRRSSINRATPARAPLQLGCRTLKQTRTHRVALFGVCVLCCVVLFFFLPNNPAEFIIFRAPAERFSSRRVCPGKMTAFRAFGALNLGPRSRTERAWRHS